MESSLHLCCNCLFEKNSNYKITKLYYDWLSLSIPFLKKSFKDIMELLPSINYIKMHLRCNRTPFNCVFVNSQYIWF